MADAAQPSILDVSGIAAIPAGGTPPAAAPAASPPAAASAPASPDASAAPPALDVSNVPAETPQQTLTRLEPVITDPKADPATREAAQEAWKNAYVADVTANGPGVRAERFAGQVSPSGIAKSVLNVGNTLNQGALAIAKHPLTGIPAAVQGVGMTFGDLAKGAVDTGAGVAEQAEAALAPHYRWAAEAAARLALLRAQGDQAYNDLSGKVADASGNAPAFQAGRTVGQAVSTELAPESVQGPEGALATASKAAGSAAKTATKATEAVVSAPGTIPMKAGLAVASDLPVVGGGVKAIRSAGTGLSVLNQNAPQILNSTKAAADSAKDAFEAAQAAATDPEQIATLAKNARDATMYHNLVSAGLKTLQAAKKAPGLGDVVGGVVNKAVAPAVIGGALGTAQEGLTATAGDPNAASQGAAGGSLLGVYARHAMNLQAPLAQLGEARLRAEQRLVAELPTTLPDTATPIDQAKLADLTAQEIKNPTPTAPENDLLNGPGGAPEVPVATPALTRGEILATPAGKPPIVFTPSGEGLPETIPAAQDVREAAANSVPVKEPTPAAPAATTAVDEAPAPAAPETAPLAEPAGTASNAPLARPSADRPDAPLPKTAPKRNFIQMKTGVQYNPREVAIAPADLPPDSDLFALPATHAPVESSNLQSVGYQPKNNLLSVLFKDGRHYIHTNVTPELHQQFMDAPSQGKFYNKTFRGTSDYPYLVIGTNLFK